MLIYSKVPKNRGTPFCRSTIPWRKGRSKIRVTPVSGGAPEPELASTTVAAAASVPCSFTSILAAWMTWERK